MEYIVLGLLMLCDMTIYELNSSFSRGLTLIYSASYGNLQYAVKKLLKTQMIDFEEKVDNGRNKKIYHINSSGKEYFFEWMHKDITANDIETVMLSKIYFLGIIKDNSEKEKIIDSIMAVADENISMLNAIHKQNQSLKLPSEAMEIAKYQFATMDYGLGVFDFAMKWLQSLKDELILK